MIGHTAKIIVYGDCIRSQYVLFIERELIILVLGRYWQTIDDYRDLNTSYAVLAAILYAPDCNLDDGVPVDHGTGKPAKIDRFCQSLAHDFSNYARRIELLIAGGVNDNEWYCIRLQCRL